MKKLFILITLLICTVACSDAKDIDTSNHDSKHQKEDAIEVVNQTVDYTLTFDNLELKVHDNMANVLEVLGEPDFYFEAESCAFQGLDKTYTYGGIEIHSYEKNGNDYIASILFIDDTIQTNEGISLFDSKDKMLENYSEDYIENLSMFTYQGEHAKINFLVENGEITSIEYLAMNIEQ